MKKQNNTEFKKWFERPTKTTVFNATCLFDGISDMVTALESLGYTVSVKQQNNEHKIIAYKSVDSVGWFCICIYVDENNPEYAIVKRWDYPLNNLSELLNNI